MSSIILFAVLVLITVTFVGYEIWLHKSYKKKYTATITATEECTMFRRLLRIDHYSHTIPKTFDSKLGKRTIMTSIVPYNSAPRGIYLWYRNVDTETIEFELYVSPHKVIIKDNNANLSAKEIDLAIYEYERQLDAEIEKYEQKRKTCDNIGNELSRLGEVK